MPENKYPWHQKVAYDMSNLYLDHDSILYCGECHERLGVLHTLRYALFKKPGAEYYVPCKACHYSNLRIKGFYKQQVREQWERLQK